MEVKVIMKYLGEIIKENIEVIFQTLTALDAVISIIKSIYDINHKRLTKKKVIIMIAIFLVSLCTCIVIGILVKPDNGDPSANHITIYEIHKVAKDTSASFSLDTEGNQDVQWTLYLMCTDNVLDEKFSGEGKEISFDKLMPTTKYTLKIDGLGENEASFTTEKSEDALMPYLEVRRIEKSDNNAIAINFYNSGKNQISRKIRYKVTDKNGYFVEDGEINVVVGGGSEKTMTVAIKKSDGCIELYTEDWKFIKSKTY